MMKYCIANSIKYHALVGESDFMFHNPESGFIMHDRKVVIKGQLIITHPGITHFDELTGSLILDVFAM